MCVINMFENNVSIENNRTECTEYVHRCRFVNPPLLTLVRYYAIHRGIGWACKLKWKAWCTLVYDDLVEEFDSSLKQILFQRICIAFSQQIYRIAISYGYVVEQLLTKLLTNYLVHSLFAISVKLVPFRISSQPIQIV